MKPWLFQKIQQYSTTYCQLQDRYLHSIIISCTSYYIIEILSVYKTIVRLKLVLQIIRSLLEPWKFTQERMQSFKIYISDKQINVHQHFGVKYISRLLEWRMKWKKNEIQIRKLIVSKTETSYRTCFDGQKIVFNCLLFDLITIQKNICT